jgi:ABC-type polysaccharide/polyol phosphate transport system ATPase subunit
LRSASEHPGLTIPGASSPGEQWAVKVEGLSLTYRTAIERKPTLKKTLIRLGRRERTIREIQALQDVSFEVPHGTVLGVMGANGAGKSTLLRTLAGILPPTQGKVEVFGRVSTLLALGVGFKGELTGRENVVLGGLAAGLTRAEVNARFDQIAEFAELGEFIDMPMRTYSAGMYGRLAFSVAVNMDPDILLIDEALSTGDARFRQKSFDKMRELCAQARTIFLVSHGLAAIRKLCQEVMWLHEGRVVMRDEPETVIEAYKSFLSIEEENDEAADDDV